MSARSVVRSPRGRRGGLPRLLVALLIAALTLGSVGLAPARPAVAAPNPFADVSAGDPAYTAITELAARDVIRGFACPGGGRCFAPGDNSLRAQMAALIARASGWEAEDRGNGFVDRCDPAAGCIDDDLWRNVGTLGARGVAKGFDPTRYAPHELVLKQQVILFISRARQQSGQWATQPDNARLYTNAASDPADRRDIATYVFYAGAPPDAPTILDQPWGEYATPATRGWFARALWQAYQPGPAVTAPPPGPSPTPSPPPAPSGPPTSPNTAAFVALVLALTNAERLKMGCQPLKSNPQLTNAAQAHAVDMAQQDFFSHTGSDGSSAGQRATRAGFVWKLVSENIAAGYQTPEAVVTGWMNSSGHRANILNCGLQSIGIGYYFFSPDGGNEQWQHYWVQLFATPR